VKIKVVSRVLEANERIAEENRKLLKDKGVFVLNLMSAPGAGKTSLLIKTIELLKSRVAIGVIEGDITGTEDAERIGALRVPVVQINTGGACHLDANMINTVLQELPLDQIRLLFIENVGNLVCPAEFNVGEDMKVMILSVTEGEDKPLKYPLMFQESQVLLINKIDLLPYLDIDIERLVKNSLKVNPQLKIFTVSCKSGEGLSQWTDFLLSKINPV
jgi:hydrogenase nickel incorporation protein HypB